MHSKLALVCKSTIQNPRERGWNSIEAVSVCRIAAIEQLQLEYTHTHTHTHTHAVSFTVSLVRFRIEA